MNGTTLLQFPFKIIHKHYPTNNNESHAANKQTLKAP